MVRCYVLLRACKYFLKMQIALSEYYKLQILNYTVVSRNIVKKFIPAITFVGNALTPYAIFMFELSSIRWIV